jgi:Flp pilus assembly protein TadD
LAENSFQSLDNYPYAIDYFLKFLDHSGSDASVLYNLGLSYMKYHNDDQACVTFRKAIELGEERAEAPMDKVCF